MKKLLKILAIISPVPLCKGGLRGIGGLGGFILFYALFQISTLVYAGEEISQQDYIDKYKDIAVREMHRSGIPASITLAQGILESRYGNSSLAVKANNHFGIKCHKDWKGKKVHQDDDAKNECFRKYKNARQSYIDHTDFLITRPRYEFLFDLEPFDYKGWAYGLKKAGYATNPQYATRLIQIVEEYQLYQYDLKKREVTFDYAAYLKKEQAVSFPDTDVFEYNGIKTVLVKEGDIPYMIAEQYDIGLSRLYKYNDLIIGDKPAPGTKIYLQPKRGSASVKYHIVKYGENMKAISQMYGIQLKMLHKKNLMEFGTKPKAGERLWLKSKRKHPPKLQYLSKYGRTETYTVKQGDTLYSIAKQYDLRVSELKRMNNLETDNINPGDVLIVVE